MKRLICIFCLIVISIFLCGCGEKSEFPKPTEEFYVNDFANVISKENETEMLSRAVTLNNKTTAQVVVVTVESLNGLEPYDYALQIGREWGVGSKESDNGIVILLSTGEREIYIAVGYGLEGAMPDSKTGRIIDRYGLDYLKADDFSAGLTAISRAVINEIYIEYGIEPEEGYISIENLPDGVYSEESALDISASWAILIIILFILSLFLRRGRGPFIFFGGPGMFMGGSGHHRGGSGGFGGFSGGGGSFGGGGAGRGF